MKGDWAKCPILVSFAARVPLWRVSAVKIGKITSAQVVTRSFTSAVTVLSTREAPPVVLLICRSSSTRNGMHAPPTGNNGIAAGP